MSLPIKLLKRPERSFALELANETTKMQRKGDKTMRLGLALNDELQADIVAVLKKHVSTFA